MSYDSRSVVPPARAARFPASKFSPPHPVSQLVHRGRLFDRLDDGEKRRLSLVVGSPGSGKTILLADWLATRVQRPAAWLSCDPSDANPRRFVAALIEAARRGYGDPTMGEDALELINLEGEVSPDAVAALADDFDSRPAKRLLVIDDFHFAGHLSTDVLGQLLTHRPASLQLVIASRAEPRLGLHRMRASQELAEIRNADLAFSVGEAGLFLADFGLMLEEAEVKVLQNGSEGWIAGLQMAAISMQASPDRTSGPGPTELRSRTVAGYFLEEVLYRQQAEVVDFMLGVSVLDELSVEACTALLGSDSSEMLDHLYRAQLFVTLVDEDSETYRYHHLIRDVLRAELRSGDPARETALHRSAARYLSDHGHVAAAAQQLVAAGGSKQAFALLNERIVQDVLTNPRVGSALDLDDLRPEAFAAEPEILVALAAELLWRGAFETGARAVRLARTAHIDPVATPELAVKLALVNTLYSSFVGEFEEGLAYRNRALGFQHVATGVDDWIVTMDALAMYCHTYLGQYAEARKLAGHLQTARVSEPLTEVLCPGVLSQAALLEGDLDEAGRLAAETMAAARRLKFDRHYFAFHALRTTSLLDLEMRDLDAAIGPIEEALALVNGARPAFNCLAQLDRAQVWAAAGDLEEALSSLPAARSALKSGHSVLLRLADELEARFRLGLGDSQGALNAAGRLDEDRRVILSTSIALALGDAAAAEGIMRSAPREGSTIRSELELRLLRAAVAIKGSPAEAPRAVRHALVLVERHGYVQTVIDACPGLVDHLIASTELYPRTERVAALISAGLQARKANAHPHRAPDLAEPLTDAEIRVLEKLTERLTYVDIAADLYVSVNTVKTHLRHVYMKLGVTSRASAVKRASTLGLL